MSRSQAKSYRNLRTSKYEKTLANRKVRQVPVEDDIDDGNSYKKISESWDINDGGRAKPIDITKTLWSRYGNKETLDEDIARLRRK